MNILQLVNEALRNKSFLFTCTIKDESKEENNLTHYLIRENFATDDIIPSLDASVRSMGIVLPKPVDVIVPPKVYKDNKPLKIAILSHFNRMPESYSPARAVKNQIKLLVEHGNKVVFFTQEGSELDLGCEMRPIVPRFKREKMVVNEEMKKKFIDVLRENLTSDFDIAITHDFFLQDTVTYSEAVRECGVPIQWLHFARSGIGHNMDFSMPNARFVYLNKADIGQFARAIKVPVSQCRSIYNEKDPNFMFQWNPITRMIVNKFQLWDRDIIQTYPVCSTRLDAKGLDFVIKTFVELKRLGNKVMLVVCNSNGRKRVDDLKRKCEMAKDMGLNENEFIFTSLLADEQYKIESEVPNKVAAELMQISNLFIFPTIAEVGPNILLEAAMGKNLIVVNSDLPLMYDFVDKENVISYAFSSSKSLHFSGRDTESLAGLAKQIVGQLKSNKADLTFRKVWKNHNAESIYRNMLEPVLREDFNNK